MNVYGYDIATDRGLTNLQFSELMQKLVINNFRGVYMRDTLPTTPSHRECGIVNLNTSSKAGNHRVCYYKDGKRRLYFDFFGRS